MSLSLASAVKAKLEATAPAWRPDSVAGCPVFRDAAPAGQSMPYVTVAEGLGFAPSVSTPGMGIEIVQVNVWQAWRPLDSSAASSPYDGQHKESPLLGPNLARALHMAQFDTAPQRVYFTTVINSVRLPDRDSNIVHHAITTWVRRSV